MFSYCQNLAEGNILLKNIYCHYYAVTVIFFAAWKFNIKEIHMEKINLAEGLMAQMMEEEAWKNLSRNFGFTIQMLEKYQDNLDWKEVSENTTIVWTMDILEKFKKRISWKAFSEYCDESILTPEILGHFKEYFDWHALSSKSDLPMFIYDKYSDLLDWNISVR